MFNRFNTRVLAAAALLLAAASAHAQTWSVTPTKGAGPFTLTWDAGPGATNCQAAGIADWSGTVASSGTKQLTPAKGTKQLTLVCSAPGPTKKGWVQIFWDPATQNVDGTTYTDAKDVLVFASKTSPPTPQIAAVPVGTNTWKAENLDAGKWFFGAKSRNTKDVTSDLSAIANATVADIPTTITVTLPPLSIEVTDPSKPKAPVITVTVGTE